MSAHPAPLTLPPPLPSPAIACIRHPPPGVVEDRDVCLLGEVKAAFRSAGVSRLSSREAAVQEMQRFLFPKPKPKGEDEAGLAKEFLKLAQHGQLLEARQLLQGRPKLLHARSTSKGYTAMHYAAMGASLPLLEWLAEQGLKPDVLSQPKDASPALTPAQVAHDYKRDAAVASLSRLAEAYAFLSSAGAELDDAAKLRAAARAGCSAAAAVLLRRSPALARTAAVAESPHGALVAAARGWRT